MRKHQQTQLLELIETLKEANAEIRRLMTSGETQAIIDLMSDCQETVIQIGEFIEQLEGEGTKTVSYLEQYHELLYKACIRFVDSDIDDGIGVELQSGLARIEFSIRTELKPRIEILFLPYKASMWDSMESIWLAAKDDPQCDAFVVPIPYYDKLPDGTFDKMHYEGSQYPDYVPVMDWQAYDIENRHPDIIIVHYPYDSGNFVTSVHPLFYCKRLKNLTDLLVYIPYFVCVDDVQEHLCVNAGTLYADRVIVQSEKIRQTYIKAFRRFEDEKNCRDRFGKAETKFVTLGSPKFDKVINTGRENCKIPDEWRKLIEKPDGTRKKVILYNTSIDGLLNGNERVLDKIRHVMDCFRIRNDAVLLWRPHPLNVTTYQAMRPLLLKDYLGIIAEYRRQGFGIYDDTPDLNRAIAISDAYFGDWSSLVALYQCTGKPVMIQNVDVGQADTDVATLTFEYLYEDGDDFWFTASNFNALFRMDKQTWKPHYISSFQRETASGQRLYGPIIAYDGKLYFTPCLAREIAEYDTERNTIRKISLPDIAGRKRTRDMTGLKFGSVFQYKTWLFFVGCHYPAIVRIDMLTGELDCFSDWLEPLGKLASEHETVYFKSACVTGSLIVAAAMNANAVVVFDMDTCISKVYEVGSKKCRYSGICFDGNDYWMSPRLDGPVVRWNPDTTYTEYNDLPDGFEYGTLSFWTIRYSAGYVWLFPNQANMALKINIQDERIEVAQEFQPECESDLPGPNYIFSKEIGENIFAFTGKTNHLIGYNYRTGNRREEPILLMGDVKDAVAIGLKTLLKDPAACETEFDCLFYENEVASINDFLNYLVCNDESVNLKMLRDRQIEIFRMINRCPDGTSGTTIFQYCRQAIMAGKEGNE